MLIAVMLVLREVLEAALFVSLLLALGTQLQLRWRWERLAIPLGVAASWTLGHYAYPIMAAFDGMGQELLNATLYGVAILCFVALAVTLIPTMRAGHVTARMDRRLLYPAFVVIVTASMAREGSEIWLYLSSFAGDRSALTTALMGGAIGTGIGLSLCTLVYYFFAFLPQQAFLRLFVVLATLVAGGLSMQMAKLGMQSGYLLSGDALWDTGWLVNERSWLGQLFHALFGYDANPEAAQVAFYAAVLAAVAVGAGWQWQRRGDLDD